MALNSTEETGPLRGLVGRTLRRRSIRGGSHGVYRATGRRKLSMHGQACASTKARISCHGTASGSTKAYVIYAQVQISRGGSDAEEGRKRAGACCCRCLQGHCASSRYSPRVYTQASPLIRQGEGGRCSDPIFDICVVCIRWFDFARTDGPFVTLIPSPKV